MALSSPLGAAAYYLTPAGDWLDAIASVDEASAKRGEITEPLGVDVAAIIAGGATGSAMAKGSILNRGGSYGRLFDRKLAGEVPHHIPQNGFMKWLVGKRKGPAVGMTLEDHELTRTFAGRGSSALKTDAKLKPRPRLLKEVRDIRTLFGAKYRRGCIEAIK